MDGNIYVTADCIFDGNSIREELVRIEIEGDVISRINPWNPERAIEGTVLDARGALVLPGLINTHTHVARGGMFRPNETMSVDQVVRNLRDILAAGVTTVGDMGCTPGLVYSLRKYLDRHPACGPSIVACGPLLTVSGGYPLDWLHPLVARLGVVLLCDSEDEARRSVRSVVKMDMDHVKLAIMHRSYAQKPLRTISEGAARAVVDEAHALGYKVLAHAHYLDDYRMALDVKVDALMHSCFDPLDSEMVARVKDSGIPVSPTLWIFEGAIDGVERRLDRDPRYIRHVSGNIRRDWTDFCEKYLSSGDVVPEGTAAGGLPKERGREAVKNTAENFRKLLDAGVPMALGNDASYGFSLVGRPVDELKTMQRHGMSPVDCLKAATSNAASLLGLDDRGVLEPGKRADIVIAERAAITDIGALENTRAVVHAGHLVEDTPARSALHAAGTATAVVAGVGRTIYWGLPGRK